MKIFRHEKNFLFKIFWKKKKKIPENFLPSAINISSPRSSCSRIFSAIFNGCVQFYRLTKKANFALKQKIFQLNMASNHTTAIIALTALGSFVAGYGTRLLIQKATSSAKCKKTVDLSEIKKALVHYDDFPTKGSFEFHSKFSKFLKICGCNRYFFSNRFDLWDFCKLLAYYLFYCFFIVEWIWNCYLFRFFFCFVSDYFRNIFF